MDRAVGIVVTALKNALADERGRWLLGPHPVVRSEYRLRNRERSFRIDRYFEDANGKKWVVDYKTSEHEGAGVEVFLDLQRSATRRSSTATRKRWALRAAVSISRCTRDGASGGIVRVGTTKSELAIEMFFPADQATAEAVRKAS